MRAPNGWPRTVNVGDRVASNQLSHAQIRYRLDETGSIKEAAPILGLHPGALSRKISREKIQWTKNAKHEPEANPSPARPKGEDAKATDDDASGSTDD